MLWLKSQGLSHQRIAKLAGVCGNAVTKYLKMYRQGGLDEVKRVNFYQPKSELENHRDTIEQYFRDNPVASIAEAVDDNRSPDRNSAQQEPGARIFEKDRHAVSQSGGDTGRCRPRRASRL